MGDGGDVSGERFQLGDYWLAKRAGSPYWYRMWFDPATRQTQRVSLGTSDLETAKVALAQWYVAHSALKDAPPDTVPIATLMQRYQAQVGDDLPSRDVVRRAAKLWGEYWQDRTVSDLTAGALDDFKDWLLARELAMGYVRRILGVGQTALNRARDRQELTRVPPIKLPSDSAVFEHTASIAQLRKLLNAIPADSHLWTYCLIRLNTACRGDAALDLRPAQVDMQHGFVRLNPAGRAQTKKRRPDVPLTGTLKNALSGLPDASVPYVNWNGEPVDSIKTAWRAVREDAGLPVWFVPKIIRHTVATELRRRGVPGWEVSGLLGHTRGDSAATTGRYAKYAPDWMRASRTTLDAYMAEIGAKVPRLKALARSWHAGKRNRLTRRATK